MPTDFQRDLLTRRLTDATRQQPAWAQLSARLLALGGELIVARYEEDLDALLADGRALTPASVTVRPARPSQCHANSAAEHQRDPSWAVATGWALSDGVWRQHSWCQQRTPHGVELLETTEQRDVYYGIELTARAAAAFCRMNA